MGSKAESNRAYRERNRKELAAKTRAYTARNREKVLEQKRKYYSENRSNILAAALRRAHGMQPADFAAMWAAQDGKCYLCDGALVDGKVHVDHDHSCCGPKTSCAICRRGLAHSDCNVTIGAVGDDPARLRRMADALEAAQLAVAQRRADAGERLLLIE